MYCGVCKFNMKIVYGFKLMGPYVRDPIDNNSNWKLYLNKQTLKCLKYVKK